MGRVLIVNPYYFPGWKSGGPQRTIKNLCDAFGDSHEIYILTQNFDFGENVPYDVPIDVWTDFGNARVKYVAGFTFSNLEKEYEQFDVIYACGLFEQSTRILLRVHRRHRKESKRFYVAPMGVFSEKAIRSKGLKKRAFLAVCKFCGWFRGVIWSFTSELERQDAVKALGKRTIEKYMIAEDMPRKFSAEEQIQKRSGRVRSGALRVVFLARICPKKNLLQCFDILKNITDAEIVFDIYGVMEDEGYWEKCERAMADLPKNVHAGYCGEALPEEVLDIFSEHDTFLFPTKGENYGHVIFEALAAGCVPIISNLTPWQDLGKKNCGFVCSFSDTEEYVAALRKLMAADQKEYYTYCQNAIRYASDKYTEACASSGFLKVLNEGSDAI